MAKQEKSKKDNRHFFKDFKAELKKVIWPTPKQVLNSTMAVVVIVLITAAIVFILDLTFETLNTHGIDRLKNVVGTSENNTVSAGQESVENEISNVMDTENNIVSE